MYISYNIILFIAIYYEFIQYIVYILIKIKNKNKKKKKKPNNKDNKVGIKKHTSTG